MNDFGENLTLVLLAIASVASLLATIHLLTL
jgi:hypothetical protein